MKTTMPSNKGFTLIELMIVIAIIAILVAVAMPRLGGINALTLEIKAWL